MFQDVPGVDDVAEIWRHGSVVGRPGCLRVGVGLWEVVGELSWPSEHLSALIGSVHDLDLNTTHKKPLKRYVLKQEVITD